MQIILAPTANIFKDPLLY